MPTERESSVRDEQTQHRQLAFTVTEVTTTKPEPTDAERAERHRLRAAGEAERQRREDVWQLELQRAGWRRRAENAKRLRAMTLQQRAEHDAEEIRWRKVQAIKGSLPDIGENDQASAIWAAVHANMDAIVAKLPDTDEESWNSILVGLGVGFVSDDDSDGEYESA